MQFDDWLNGAALLAVGVFLGLAVSEFLKLDGAAVWRAILSIIIPFGFVFLLIVLMDRIGGPVKPAAVRRWIKRKPLALQFFLPAGILIGAVGAQFGLTEILL